MFCILLLPHPTLLWAIWTFYNSTLIHLQCVCYVSLTNVISSYCGVTLYTLFTIHLESVCCLFECEVEIRPHVCSFALSSLGHAFLGCAGNPIGCRCVLLSKVHCEELRRGGVTQSFAQALANPAALPPELSSALLGAASLSSRALPPAVLLKWFWRRGSLTLFDWNMPVLLLSLLRDTEFPVDSSFLLALEEFKRVLSRTLGF